MKKLSLFIVLLLSSFITISQTLHTIIFTDTQDESIGIAARASHDNYSDFLLTIETALGIPYSNTINQIDKKGYECNNKNLLHALENLPIKEDDIVVFIYIGHGARGINDWSNFPQMCLAIPQGSIYRDEKDFYPLENVRDMIMQKNPRFCLVIGDCCNSYSPSVSTKPHIDPTFAAAPDIIRRQGENIIKQLFLSKHGSVVLTASVKGQYGWCITKGPTIGMFLEKNINDVFQDIKDGKATFFDWETLLSKIREKTYNFSNTLNLTTIENGQTVRWTQTPYYEINLTDAPKIKPYPPKEPTDLQQAIIQVADSRTYSDTERIANSIKLQAKYFDGNNALIDVVGKDKKTIIQSTSIDIYLRRIATESDLANITILEQRKDDQNKVIYLKVHEIYVEPLQ